MLSAVPLVYSAVTLCLGPVDTTSLAARARPARLTTEASRASRAVRAARLQPAALAPSSATSRLVVLPVSGPNLSSGAIAGISVAVNVVAGGFVALTGMRARASPMPQTESDADALLGLPKLVCEGLLCRPELTPPADRPQNGGSDDMAPVSSSLQWAACSASRRQDHFVDAE